MRTLIRSSAPFLAGSLVFLLLAVGARADDSKAPSGGKAAESPAEGVADSPAIDLLDALHDGLVSVRAEGIGDGRLTMSLTNRTRRRLRVVLPPGIVAQGATGQMGGMMGGMGGGMGGMGGGMGGMGGGMGGGMMGGGTMPPMMGMMTLARMIMYFCGDFDSWDMRSLMMGMGGMGMGGMGGGMGGMGGGMMGGMGGGMRSVPPTGLAFADLRPGQTRNLPTRMVSLNPPGAEGGVQLPEKGERFQIVGDIASVNDDPLVQRALRRLAADKAPTTISQVVMWRLAGRLEWDAIADLAQKWANGYELALARDFVEHLDKLPEGELGSLLFQVDGIDARSAAMAAEIRKAVEGKTVLGLLAGSGIPARPEGPAVACRVRLTAGEASVQVTCSDATARRWVPYGKFSLPVAPGGGRFDALRFTDALAQEIVNRLVRTHLVLGPRVKGKRTHQIRIENASPLILNGLAVLGTTSPEGETPKVLSGISIPPRKSMTVPASEEAVKLLGLKKGMRVAAVDLSGL